LRGRVLAEFYSRDSNTVSSRRIIRWSVPLVTESVYACHSIPIVVELMTTALDPQTGCSSWATHLASTTFTLLTSTCTSVQVTLPDDGRPLQFCTWCLLEWGKARQGRLGYVGSDIDWIKLGWRLLRAHTTCLNRFRHLLEDKVRGRFRLCLLLFQGILVAGHLPRG
jgi:hypothetical protein